MVRHVHLGHGAGLYRSRAPASDAYLVCERCAGVARSTRRSCAGVRAEIREVTGYDAHFGHFPIHGLCRRAPRRRESGRRR